MDKTKTWRVCVSLALDEWNFSICRLFILLIL